MVVEYRLKFILEMFLYYPILWLVIIYLATKSNYNRNRVKIIKRYFVHISEVKVDVKIELW